MLRDLARRVLWTASLCPKNPSWIELRTAWRAAGFFVWWMHNLKEPP